MKKQLLPGDVITPAPGCDWFEPPHPLLIIVSATPPPLPFPWSSHDWWQVTTTPPLTSLKDTAVEPADDDDLRHGLILPSEWTIIDHHE